MRFLYMGHTTGCGEFPLNCICIPRWSRLSGSMESSVFIPFLETRFNSCLLTQAKKATRKKMMLKPICKIISHLVKRSSTSFPGESFWKGEVWFVEFTRIVGVVVCNSITRSKNVVKEYVFWQRCLLLCGGYSCLPFVHHGLHCVSSKEIHSCWWEYRLYNKGEASSFGGCLDN